MGKFKAKTGKSRVGTALSKIGGAVKKASSFGAQGGLVGKAVSAAKGSYGNQAGSSIGFGSKPKVSTTKAVGVSYGTTPNTQEGPKKSGGGSSHSQASFGSGGGLQVQSRERTQPVVPATIGEKPIVDIPTVPVDQTDYMAMVPQAPQTPLDQFQATEKTNFESMMANLVAPPSTESIYAKAQKESGILQRQKEVNQLSEQLNLIQANAQANQLKTIGQGRGIPEAILGGQQAQIGREAAIAALPVSAQLQAAQGNLEMAEQNLNTLFSIRSADAKAKYEYKNNLIKSVYDFASGQEKQKLDYAMKLEDRKYQEQKANESDIRSLALMAAKNGASASILSKISQSGSFGDALSSAGSYVMSPSDKKAQLEYQELLNPSSVRVPTALKDIKSTDREAFINARTTLNEVDEIKQILSRNVSNLKSLEVSTSDDAMRFRQLRSNVVDKLARERTGAVIGNDEKRDFKKILGVGFRDLAIKDINEITKGLDSFRNKHLQTTILIDPDGSIGSYLDYSLPTDVAGSIFDEVLGSSGGSSSLSNY